MKFMAEHIRLKDPAELFKHVNLVAERLMENDDNLDVPTAINAACVMIAFQVAGKEEMTKDEIYKYANQIFNDCTEYIEHHPEAIDGLTDEDDEPKEWE